MFSLGSGLSAQTRLVRTTWGYPTHEGLNHDDAGPSTRSSFGERGSAVQCSQGVGQGGIGVEPVLQLGDLQRAGHHPGGQAG